MGQRFVDWKLYNEAYGGWYIAGVVGAHLHVIPDMDKNRYFWSVVWNNVPKKIKIGGTAPDVIAAKKAALDCYNKGNPDDR